MDSLIIVAAAGFVAGYWFAKQRHGPLVYEDAVYQIDDVIKALRLACECIFKAYNVNPTEQDLNFKQRMLLREAQQGKLE